MKRITILVMALISSMMLVACSEDGGVAVTPDNPGITPVATANKIIWSATSYGVQSRYTLAQMMTRYGNQQIPCYIEGDYPHGEIWWVDGNLDCENYTDAVQVTFTYDKVTKVAEIFVDAYCLSWVCGNGAYVSFSRSANNLISRNGSPYNANFGTTYTSAGAVPINQKSYVVEVEFPNTVDLMNDQIIPLSLYYGDHGTHRNIGTFQLERQ